MNSQERLFIQMRKGFSWVAVLLFLLRMTAPAQIPVPLQIGITNGTVTVSSPSNSGGAYGLGQFETTTNLSSPIVWTGNWEPIGEIFFSFPATNSQEFFRYVQVYPIFQFAIFYNLNMEIAPGAGMAITGPVFCNQSIWEGSEFVTNTSTVDAVGTNNTSNTDPFLLPYIYDPHNGTPQGKFLKTRPASFWHGRTQLAD
jgi:hypothetical protein